MLVQNENKNIIAKLRQRRDDEIQHRKSTSSPLSATFLSEANTTDMIHRKTNRLSNYAKSHPHLPRTLTRQLSNIGPGEEYKVRRLSSGPAQGGMSNNNAADDDGSHGDLEDLLFEESEVSVLPCE